MHFWKSRSSLDSPKIDLLQVDLLASGASLFCPRNGLFRRDEGLFWKKCVFNLSRRKPSLGALEWQNVSILRLKHYIGCSLWTGLWSNRDFFPQTESLFTGYIGCMCLVICCAMLRRPCSHILRKVLFVLQKIYQRAISPVFNLYQNFLKCQQLQRCRREDFGGLRLFVKRKNLSLLLFNWQLSFVGSSHDCANMTN